MKKREIIFGIITLCVLAAAIYFVGKYLFSFFSTIDRQTLITLISITIPLVATIFTVYLGRYFENKKAVQEKLREHKIPVYNEFIESSLKYLLDKEAKQEKKDAEILKFMRSITPKMMIWADDKSIKAWSDFRIQATKQDNRPLILMEKFEDIILAMRKDLGHKNKDLDRHELLKCFINDLD